MTYLTYIEYVKGHIKIGLKYVFIRVYYIEFASRIRILQGIFLIAHQVDLRRAQGPAADRALQAASELGRLWSSHSVGSKVWFY